MNYSLLYLARPNYGGWVTFTAHLQRLLPGSRLYKIGNKLERKTRDFGYDVRYQNIPAEALPMLENIVITAIDKNYYNILPRVRSGKIVIHDPTELKKELIPHLEKLEVITIRKKVHDLLIDKYSLNSQLINHPYQPFEYKETKKSGIVSLCRIDFDKHFDIVLDSNIPIDIYGSANTMYVYHKLDKDKFNSLYKGHIPKTSQAIQDVLLNKRYFVDMSLIKGDGGGTQYSFLEAINAKCVLILQKAWIEAGDTFKHEHNCIAVSSAKELADAVNRYDDETLNKIADNAFEMLKDHQEVKL